MEIKWTPSAISDLDRAEDYIAEHDPSFIGEWASRGLEAVEFLVPHPNIGRGGRIRGTRELVVSGTPFIVIYRIRADEVQILRILHHARKWPD